MFIQADTVGNFAFLGKENFLHALDLETECLHIHRGVTAQDDVGQALAVMLQQGIIGRGHRRLYPSLRQTHFPVGSFINGRWTVERRSECYLCIAFAFVGQIDLSHSRSGLEHTEIQLVDLLLGFFVIIDGGFISKS